MAIRKANGTNPMRFALCRSMGHEWHHNRAIGTDDAGGTNFRAPFGGTYGMVGLPSTCKQCGTERMRWVTRTGEVITRYNHPNGYEQHGDERMAPVEWRKTYVATIFDAFEAGAPPRVAVAR